MAQYLCQVLGTDFRRSAGGTGHLGKIIAGYLGKVTVFFPLHALPPPLFMNVNNPSFGEEHLFYTKNPLRRGVYF